MREPAWRAEARAMTEAVPYARSQRIRRRLRQRAQATATRTRRHWSAIVAFAAGAALVLVSIFVLRPERPSIPSPSPTASAPARQASTAEPWETSASATLRASGCRGDLEALEEARPAALEGPCEVTGPGLRIAIVEAATLRGDARALVLDAGLAELDVDPDHPRDVPFSVTIPAGRIEVTGTRFTVQHDERGGALELHEGHVRLITAQGVSHVAAGERVAWVAEASRYRLVDSRDEAPPHDASTDAREPTAAATPARRPARRASSRALVENLERLRAAGRFAEAAKAIEAALPSLSRRDREVLSFELGKLVERSRGKADACDHWRAYARDFARGRYADLVAEERARLQCDATP